MALAKAYLRTKWHFHPSSRFATIDMGRKLGDCPLFWGGRRGAGSPSNTMSPGSRPTSILSGILIHPAVWSQYTWDDKWGLLCPFWEGRAGSPSNTMSPVPRPTSVPNGLLIHPAVWPQRTWAQNWGYAPFGGAGSLSNTMWPRPTYMPIFILIYIQPFGHNTPTSQTDKQDRFTNGRTKT